MRSRNHIFLLYCILGALCGCATPAVQSDISMLDKKVSQQKRDMQTVRQKQADLDERIDALQTELQRLRGGMEESKHYAQKASDDVLALREELATHIKKHDEDVNQLRAAVGMSVTAPKDPTVLQPQPPGVQPATVAPPGDLVKVTGVPDPEELYNSAYSRLNQGDLQGARTEFKKFLELFPQTEYSDNAQFWVGECFYRDKKYEEAILEFEEVVKKFPQGNKVPDALLKQAFSFIAINDTNTAKQLLQKIITQYPASAQADLAKAKLDTLK